jgi:hypothetical protein
MGPKEGALGVDQVPRNVIEKRRRKQRMKNKRTTKNGNN